MKLVYFGYDFMLPAIHRLIEDGHELLGIMSFECDNVFNFNRECQALARVAGVPIILSPVTDEHIEEFLDQGCECFISGGYPYKLPPVDEDRAYALNIHPTYLPEGRGLMPIPRIITDNIKSAAGFTAHKMTQKFDSGDILKQHKINLEPNDTVESYTAKIAIHAPSFLSGLMSDLPGHWKKAKAQNPHKATHFSPPGEKERMLDWTKSVNEVDATARAFGRFGALATIKDQLYVVYESAFWKEKHDLEPGTLAAFSNTELVVAAKDGYFLIKRFEQARF